MAKKGRDTSQSQSQVTESESEEPENEGLEISSGYESPDAPGAEDADGDYEIDAITHAIYKDSRPDKRSGEGWKGWHYTVMWGGPNYLKTLHDSEQRLENFARDGTILPEFWAEYKTKLRGRQREPEGVIGDHHEPSDALMKRWLQDTDPPRSFKAYIRRKGRRGKTLPRVLKSHSDHYIEKARQERKRRLALDKIRKASKSQTPDTTAPPRSTKDKAHRKTGRLTKASSTSATKRITSPTPSNSSSLSSPLSPRIPSSGPRLNTRRGATGRVASPSSGALDSDHEVDAVLGAEPGRESGSPDASELPLAAAEATRKRKRGSSTIAVDAKAPKGASSANSKQGTGRTESSNGKQGSRERSQGGNRREKGMGKEKGKGRKTVETEEDDDDDHVPLQKPRKSAKTTSSKLANMKFSKRPVPNHEVIDATSSSHSAPSETFGSPQTGIFELRQIDEGQNRDRSASPEQNDDLFASHDDAEEDLVGRPSVELPRSKSDALHQPSSTKEGQARASASSLGLAPAIAGSANPSPHSSFATHRASGSSRPTALVSAARATGTEAGPSRLPLAAGSVQSAPRKKYEQGVKIKGMEGLAVPGPDRPRKGGRWAREVPGSTLPGTGDLHVPLALRTSLGSLQATSAPMSAASQGSGYGSSALPSPLPTSTQPSAAYIPRSRPPTGPAQPQPTSVPLGPRPSSSSSAGRSRHSIPPSSALGAQPVSPNSIEADVTGPQGSHTSDDLPDVDPNYPEHMHRQAENLQFSSSPEPEHSPSSHPAPPLAQAYHAYPSPSSPSQRQAPILLSETVPPPAHLPTTPLSQSPTIFPGHPGSQDDHLAHRHETIGTCRISASVPPHHKEMSCDVRLLRGTPALSFDDISLQGIVGRSRSTHLYFETLEAFCLISQIMHHGSEVLEWAKVISGNEDRKEDYDEIIGLSADADPKVFATYFESPSARVDRHYALVLASARVIQFDAWGLDRGEWQAPEMGLVALLVALPLDWPPPLVPHPVDPRLHSPSLDATPVLTGPLPLLASYGLAKHINSARGKVVEYPPQLCGEQPSDLSIAIRKGFQAAGALSKDAQVDLQVMENGRLWTADTYVVENARLGTAMIPIEPTGIIHRQTSILAVGPSLSLLPSQWKAKTRWRHGGLITFSPSFILRFPDKFADIIHLMRPLRHFAAYLIPPALEWAHDSWQSPIRCPDSAKAFDKLTRALSLDEDIAGLSGDAAGLHCGGLAVSICPPSSLQPELCASWLDWYMKACRERDYGALLLHCRGVRPGRFDTLPSRSCNANTAEVESWHIRDVERSQLADMVDMRMRPDVSYRRYIFVGETTLDAGARQGFINQGIEFVHPDAVEAIFGETLRRQ